MKNIPLLDLVAQGGQLRDELMPAIEGVLSRGHFVLGEEVELFENKFAAFCNADHCVGVANGTDALQLTLRALKIGPGDEVITTANTFIATAFAISYTGASPVFVDVDPESYNIDVRLIERAITPRTKAIIPVHLYGQPAEMDAILDLAQQYGLEVVEDACQAHGALYGRRPVGSLGRAGCFSFYPGKNLGAYGDGGAVVTNDADLAEEIRMLRNCGRRGKKDPATLGFNSRLDTLQAAILLVKLSHLDEWNEKRRAVARRYRELLSDSGIILPSEKPNVRHVYHLYVIQHDSRDELMVDLQGSGISCGIHYPLPLHLSEPYRLARRVPETLPVTTRLAPRILSLPMYPELAEEQILKIVDRLGTCVKTVREPRAITPVRAATAAFAGG